MCGIVGFVGQVKPDVLEGMLSAMAHRGPDDQGVWLGPGVGLGMRRLAIIDLAGGHQPMSNEDGSLWIVFNGEIYNHRMLRTDLETKGHTFRTRCDTEAILHLYEEEGEKCVDRLRGMFAFAIWDARRRDLFLARDRLGKKPLFCWQRDGLFLFASEIKALLCHPAVSRTLNWEAFHHYLAFGYTPADGSIFAGISKLLPAHTATLRDGGVTLRRYWTLPQYETAGPMSSQEAAAHLREQLREAVRLRLESDVPLGVFLSGGMDSSAIVASMREVTGQRIATFSIGFGGAAPSFDELPYARMVAQRFETDHHEEILEPKVADLLPVIVHHFDEPFADSSAIPTFVVAQATARHVKVVLSGIGGDETFAGYPRYLGLRLSEAYRRLPGWVHPVFATVAPRLIREAETSPNRGDWIRRFIAGTDQPLPGRYIGWTRFFSEEDLARLAMPGLREQWKADVEAIPRAVFAASHPGDPVDGAFRIDLSTYLPDDLLVMADRMSMAHSLELRAPFCDQRVIEESLGIPSRMKIPGFRLKGLLKMAFADVLPQQVLSHRKQGFMIPLARWLRTDLREVMEDLLSRERVRNRGLFVPEAVEALKQEHLRSIRTHSDRLWTLMIAELWMRQYLDSDESRQAGDLRAGHAVHTPIASAVSPLPPGETLEPIGCEQAPPPVEQTQASPRSKPSLADPEQETGSEPQRMLILNVAGLGDFVMGTPALRALRRRFPLAQIWILIIPEVRGLAERCPYVDVVRTLDLRNSRSALAWALGPRRRELRQLIRELRDMRFDTAVNLYRVATRGGGVRMTAFLRAIGASRTVGRYSGGLGASFNLTSMTEGHETDAQLGVARLLGAPPTSQYPELWVTADDRAICHSLLRRHGVSVADPVVCLHPGSARPEACWPAERFAAVGRRLAEVGARVVLFGASGHRALCARIANAIPRAVSLAGETSLPVLAALLQRAVLLVTNDSGPMHMAAALGVPLVVPFGPADPAHTGPRGPAEHLVFPASADSSRWPWWKDVPAGVVADAAVRLFADASARSGNAGGDA
ncbi:MAG TPA: asparagine synthase (glutamine-hydrolyzing) [Candidatus Methylomirabilis sp.]|nr:asparagine synthase (glutamine-hydrolyzing) [Candidatus Methylomirabilis sp.]